MTPGHPHEDPAPPAQPQAQPAQVQTSLYVQEDERGVLGIGIRSHPAQPLAGGGLAGVFDFAVIDTRSPQPQKEP